MNKITEQKTVSIIIPMHNEEENIPLVYQAVQEVFSDKLEAYQLELIFVDDGSTDSSVAIVKKLQVESNDVKSKKCSVRLLEFSRNFGKEAATTAGLHASTGDAVMMIDADMQHPPALIPDFIKQWEETGADVVIGVRTKNTNEGIVKRLGSKLFYTILAKISDDEMRVGETDFRLVGRRVVDEFNKLTEHNRMTRSLINWLGFDKVYIEFTAPERVHGEARYTIFHLVRLAINSFVSNSTAPLEAVGYFGGFISLFSFLLGSALFINRYILGDPIGWAVSGAGQLAILLTFLVGLLLISMGIIGVYVGTISKNASGRPLYIVKSNK